MEPPVASTTSAELILLLIALIICSILSFLETSITALRMFRLKEISKTTTKYKSLINTLENNPSRILITILLAYNLANVVAAVLSNQIIEKLTRALNISDKVGFIVGILITSTTILIVDLIPKNLATRNDKFLKSTLGITNILYVGLYPFVELLSKLTDSIASLLLGKESDKNAYHESENEIRFLIDYVYEKGLIDVNKSNMLKSIFDLSTKTVKEVMVPETDIISISTDNNKEEIIDVFAKYQLTRLPVYQSNSDNIVGMLHQKDFFQLISKNDLRSWKEVVRPLVFIPESARLLKVLKELREQRMHMAIVLNEFGVITGLVSLEDVIEEIVGEIQDEFEPQKDKIISLKSNSWLINASIELKELNNFFNIEFEAHHSLTLAGFLTEHFQYMPKKGERLSYKNLNFQIQQASHKRIYQVLVYQNEIPDLNELEQIHN
ncbi:hemolysin family protein [Candidatus Babela massiliensis]|uniref:Hemolysins or related protein containing CBS domains n=1 Tax=Candidatus Babela massiliensis TaxID=673862 RepID=V6DG92_9BACT|nr:hemolysin family protein [Candidatus Babela massiliensis]CDK30580.1 Hemolysins or related protein containing CBS domains [Candidatus Babela massiliensis]